MAQATECGHSLSSQWRGLCGPNPWVFAQPPKKGGWFPNHGRAMSVVRFGGGAEPELSDGDMAKSPAKC